MNSINLADLPENLPVLFPVGRVVYTRSLDNWAQENLPRDLYENNLYIKILLDAHQCGVWDDLPPDDAKTNRLALKPGEEGRIFSSYTVADHKIWVITEWDRSVTTFMLPSDY
ncbi:hypothetical protein [Neisseria subflava]|jgi:ydg|uniref:hypothetical protein n=1 Tax=Neisseria TaxID=482 RepID=UPI000D2FF915|nr:hypothetical protein [Neisseria subflava]